jgi:hypothetical protein
VPIAADFLVDSALGDPSEAVRRAAAGALVQLHGSTSAVSVVWTRTDIEPARIAETLANILDVAPNSTDALRGMPSRVILQSRAMLMRNRTREAREVLLYLTLGAAAGGAALLTLFAGSLSVLFGQIANVTFQYMTLGAVFGGFIAGVTALCLVLAQVLSRQQVVRVRLQGGALGGAFSLLLALLAIRLIDPQISETPIILFLLLWPFVGAVTMGLVGVVVPPIGARRSILGMMIAAGGVAFGGFFASVLIARQIPSVVPNISPSDIGAYAAAIGVIVSGMAMGMGMADRLRDVSKL